MRIISYLAQNDFMPTSAQAFPNTRQPDPQGPLFFLLVVALIIATLNPAFAADPYARTRVTRRPRRESEATLFLESEE